MLSALASAALFGARCSPQAALGIALVALASAVYHTEETRQRDAVQAYVQGGGEAADSESYARLVEGGREPPLEAAAGAADEPVQEGEGEQRQRLVSVGGVGVVVSPAWNSRRQEG